MKILKQIAAVVFFVASMICCHLQFGAKSLLPWVLGVAAMAPVWWLQPQWRKVALMVLGFFLSVFFLDALLLHHRLAVAGRIGVPLFNVSEPEGSSRSPSGRTVIYLVGSHWLDSRYSICISRGGLFPREVELDDAGTTGPRNITMRWNGGRCSVGDLSSVVVFDEATGQVQRSTNY